MTTEQEIRKTIELRQYVNVVMTIPCVRKAFYYSCATFFTSFVGLPFVIAYFRKHTIKQLLYANDLLLVSSPCLAAGLSLLVLKYKADKCYSKSKLYFEENKPN